MSKMYLDCRDDAFSKMYDGKEFQYQMYENYIQFRHVKTDRIEYYPWSFINKFTIEYENKVQA